MQASGRTHRPVGGVWFRAGGVWQKRHQAAV